MVNKNNLLNKNSTKIFVFLLVFMLLGLTAVSAEQIDNNDTQLSDVSNSVDYVTSIQKDNNLANNIKGDTSNLDSVTDYQSLYDKVDAIKQDSTNTEYTIDLADGNYEVTTPITWGDSSSVKTLTINGNNQIIKGNSNTFITVNKGYTLNLNNLVITDCESNKDGGAINNKGTLNLDTVTLQNNKANFGGAIINSNNVTIANSKFINNSAINGGALYNTKYATAYIQDTEFETNVAENMGGAIDNDHYGNVTIALSTFNNNRAYNGGAIDNNQASLTLVYDNFTNNQATDYAGAIYNRLFANVTMIYSNLSNNYAGDDGGAIYNYFNTSFIGIGNVLDNNTALNYGGTIYNDEGYMLFQNNTIKNSHVITYGGGALYNTNYANGYFINNILINNTVKTNGGTVYASSSNLVLDGNIIENNTARQAGGLYLIQYCNVNITNNTIRNNYAETNAGAIYTNSVNLMRIEENIIENNTANNGAALYSTGNVLLNNNTISNNAVLTPTSKVVYNTGTLTSTNNIFVANTNGTDILMGETGKNTVNNNVYDDNLLETTISQIEDSEVNTDYEFNVNVSTKDVYNTTVDNGIIIVLLNDEVYYQGLYNPSEKLTIKLSDMKKENTVQVVYAAIDDDYQISTMTFNLTRSNKFTVSDYQSLYDMVESIKSDNLDEAVIDLQEGSYIVTTPISWMDSRNIKSLTINGNQQIIIGNGKNFITIEEGYELNINNLTVAYCENAQDGGAITNNGVLTLDNVNFVSNKANYGGALVNTNELTIKDCTFINNEATNGGALANTDYATAIIDHTVFYNNSAVTLGGAIYNEHYSEMTITNSGLQYNSANNGGAIDNDQATLIIDNSLLRDNTCFDYGGAIYNRFFATLNLTNNQFINNSATEDEGGAIYHYFKSDLYAYNNTFDQNYAFRYGAVIFNDDSYSLFENNTITNNVVEKFGGTVIYDANGGNATFINNVIANNSALTNGGAVYVASSDLELTNNIFDQNIANQGAAIYIIGASEVSITNNTITNNKANTNGGAIYNTVSKQVVIENNIIKSNIATQGAAIYSTGNVIFTNNEVSDNYVTGTNKIVYNTGKLEATNNNFDNNTDGNDVLFSTTGTVTANENTYTNNQLETTIEDIEDVTATKDYTFDVVVTPKEVYNTSINTGKVVIIINDEEYTSAEVADGKATITLNVKDLEGNNVVTVNYVPENNDFQESTTSFNFEATPSSETTINVDNVEVVYKDETTVSVIIEDEDANTPEFGNIIIKDSEDNEIATIDLAVDPSEFTFTATKAPGEYTYTASYIGNDQYEASETTFTVTITNRDCMITIDPIKDVAYNQNVTITGKFTDSKGNALILSTIKLNINGNEYNVKTDKKGVFTISEKVTSLGQNNITASYRGNTKYNACSTDATFNVVKQDVIVTMDEVSFTDNKIKVTGKFTDANGKALIKSRVVVYIGTAHYTVVTDNKGLYTFTGNSKTSTIDLYVAYLGNEKYNTYKSDSLTLTSA